MKHSVTLEYRLCRGCTTCIKTCPTQAIRVRSGKAIILNDRCIDCGKCIRACPHHAIKSLGDGFEKLALFDYAVALPEPALYGQFQHMDDVDIILNGLLKLGFHAVFEVARAAELLSDYARWRIREGGRKTVPQISSACPTVMRLIRMRFPRLIDHLSPTIMPMELAAILAREEAAQKTGLPPGRIGVFAIVPCSAKVTAAHAPEMLEVPVVDGALAIRDVYRRLLDCMSGGGELEPLSAAGIMGVGWACIGGESAARLDERYVAVDGVENVIRMLEEIEDGRLPEADFIELSGCVQGCVGGCLTAENPFAAHMRVKRVMKGLPVSRNRFEPDEENERRLLAARGIQYEPVFLLDEDRGAAMKKLAQIDRLEKTLPGLDCGSCGAPSCHALAEDVVMGRAGEEDCIFKVRERMQYMTGGGDADAYLPPPFRNRNSPKKTAGPEGGGGGGDI